MSAWRHPAYNVLCRRDDRSPVKGEMMNKVQKVFSWRSGRRFHLAKVDYLGTARFRLVPIFSRWYTPA